MIHRIVAVLNTIIRLKPIQIIYQVWYRLYKPKKLNVYISASFTPKCLSPLAFIQQPEVYRSVSVDGSFQFLNMRINFPLKVDWNYQGYGKLWNYNLQYANYLLQSDLDDVAKVALMKSQYIWLSDGRLPLEPYPVSLRSINMIRWISTNAIDDNKLIHYLYAELSFLSGRLEYHLLGNHLLENAFALMMGGAFFGESKWLSTAQRILRKELDEQILGDGAHFELSSMYHQIIFFRLLELIDWYSSWENKEDVFDLFLREKASWMYSWLENISFRNGDIPHFNDSANGIAYPTAWLLQYANGLGITSAKIRLGASGYRSVEQGNYELKIDFAQIGPSYQPGHAHADALSFILYHKGKPLFVEQGTSTYQIGPRRSLERSTQAHNTVAVNGVNQSEVWGGFRVGRRAQTTIVNDGEGGMYEAKHNGYKRYGIIHRRLFVPVDSQLLIEDILSEPADAVCYLHLCPEAEIEDVRHDTVLLSGGVKIIFEGFDRLFFEDYDFSDSYNVYHPAKRIGLAFKKHLKSFIYFGT